jgi:hypothetical protein
MDFSRQRGIRVIHDPGDTSLKKEIYQDLKDFSPEILLSVFYGLYIDPAIISLPSRYAINFHASLLPQYRGFAPLIWAIANGESATGVSAQFMNHPYRACPTKISALIGQSAILHWVETIFNRHTLLSGVCAHIAGRRRLFPI